MDTPESLNRLISQSITDPTIESSNKAAEPLDGRIKNLVESKQDQEPIATDTMIVVTNDPSLKRELAKTTIPLIIVGTIIAAEDYIKARMVAAHSLQSLAAAGIFNNTFYGLTVMVDSGMLGTITPLISAAFSKRKFIEAGQYYKHGVLLCNILAVPVIIVLYNADHILSFLDYNPELINIAGPYSKRICILIFPLFNLYVDNSFLKATNRFKEMVLGYFAAASIDIGLAALLIPIYGLNGQAYSSIAGLGSLCLGLKLYYFLSANCVPYKLFDFHTINRKHFLKLFSKGSPLTILTITESARTFLIGKWLDRLGPVPLAINESINNFLQFFVTPTLGIRHATQILVSRNYGQGDIINMRRIGNLGILSEVLIDLIPLIAFVVFPLQLAKDFISEQDLEDYDTSIRLIFLTSALSRILNSIKGSSAQNLNALLDNIFPTIVQVLIILFVTLPLSYLLTFTAGLDMVGINTTTCIENTIIIVPILHRWLTKNFIPSTTILPLHAESQRDNPEDDILQEPDFEAKYGPMPTPIPLLPPPARQEQNRELSGNSEGEQNRNLLLAFDSERNRDRSSFSDSIREMTKLRQPRIMRLLPDRS